MNYFTAAGLSANTTVTHSDIVHVCEFYKFDAREIARERNEFVTVFRTMSPLMSSDTSNSSACVVSTDDFAAQDEDSDSDNVCSVDNPRRRASDYSFMKPLRALEELSGFPNLYCLVSILATLAVTSCSAERAMSRVKIIKNRLRSTMLDDWFSSLVVLASERDILERLKSNDIIDKFALSSRPVRNLLFAT
jgi:hypothetical protein